MNEPHCLECWLSDASLLGDEVGVEMALRKGANPTSWSDCNTALFDAIRKGFSGIVDRLLRAGGDLARTHPFTGQTPLMAALEAQQPGAIQTLLKHEVDPASASLIPLVRAADDPSMVHLALSAGINLGDADPDTGKTALHEAAMYGYLDTVRCLLQEGAPVAVADHRGKTPLDLAALNRHHEVFRALTAAVEDHGRAELQPDRD